MYYDVVEIKPGFKGNWNVLFYSLKEDRKIQKTYVPSALGFFHYPRVWGRRRAFNMLKQVILDRHQREIEMLQHSMDAIKALDMPKLKK